MTVSHDPSPALLVDNLTISIGDGQRLFDRADLRVEAGEFVLLVGPSGSGKSTLLRAIAGLHEPEGMDLMVSGRIEVEGRPGRHDKPQPGVGLVFQDHALFDELSATDNVRFAFDHRETSYADGKEEARKLLDKLGVPDRKNLAALSGGERQRVAVARALAMDPPILLFDEPTTGLDPQRAHAVVDLIHQTHRASGKTVIVVTHDYNPFLRRKPRIIFLDTEARTLRNVDETELRARFDGPEQAQARKETPPGDQAPRLRHWIPWLESPGQAVLTLLASGIAPLCGWRRPKWKLRYLWHYLRMVALGTTALYVAIAAAMLGFVTVFFAFSQFPYAQVTTPLLTEEFLAATGYSAYRVLVPLLIAILMAGKCGASVAADLGARRVTRQFDALRNLGVDPAHYLHGNVVIALLIAGPLLTMIAYLSNCYASLIAFLMTSEETTVTVFSRNYFATVWPITHAVPAGTGWVMLKAATSGILIAALSYAIGSRPKVSSVDVGRDVGLTIFWASLGVLMLHALYSFVEF